MSNIAGSVTLDGVTSSSNSLTSDQIRERLDVTASTETPAPETSTPDLPDAPASDAPPVETPTPEAKPAARKDPTKDPKTRIDKATFEREEARREAARERSERERVQKEFDDFRAQNTPKPQTTAPVKPAGEAEPTLDQFSDQADPYAAYLRAMARYDLKQELATREQAALEARTKYQQEQTAKHREQAEFTRMQGFGQKLSQAFATNPDLEAQMAASNIEITRPMADAIIESDAPHALIAHLLAHPEMVDEIVALPPLKQFRALARLDAQLESPASSGASGGPVSKPKTAAEPPISPIGGSTATPAGGPPDPKTCTQEQWNEYWDKQERDSRRAGRR